MKTIPGLMLLCFALLGVAGLCAGGEPPLAVEEIVAKSNHAALYQGDDCKGAVHITITDKQGRVRKRSFNMLRMNTDKQDQDQKYFVYFLEPSDVRKMVFMVHKHAGLDSDDDRWMYLPSLDLVKRIAASDKRTSFVGSHFLYEDISGRSPEEDTHKLIGTTENHYIVDNSPKDKSTVEFSHYIATIDKETFLPVKLEYYKRDDRPYRIMEVREISRVKATHHGKSVSYPTAVRTVVRDLENGGGTEMAFSNVRYNLGLNDSLFSERYLRHAPREVIR
ncbi:MAG: outer membrane lipoprotein-sorting protein [Desulfovibrionaceae bacterium]